MPMVEINCKICKRPFIASTIEAAMGRLRAHEAERHNLQAPEQIDREKREAGYYDTLLLTAEDLLLLQGMKISTV
jgi:hypothetical protein